MESLSGIMGTAMVVLSSTGLDPGASDCQVRLMEPYRQPSSSSGRRGASPYVRWIIAGPSFNLIDQRSLLDGLVGRNRSNSRLERHYDVLLRRCSEDSGYE